jgi:LmbE family N-acetylglucosaminyl deacetylase
MNLAAVDSVNEMRAFPSEAMVVRRPHFHLRGDSLYFMISRRPFAVLNVAEQELWQRLEPEASVGTLRTLLGGSMDESIHRLLALGVAETLPPPLTGTRRRVMVVEPHMDDAVLSVGGLMLQRRSECEFLIVTLATQSVATSYRDLDRDFFDIEIVSGIRKAESGIVARLLLGRHVPLELADATMRYNPQNWTLEWFRRHKPAVYTALQHAPGPDELAQWTSTLANAIRDLQPDEIWMPLGVGVHTDHQLTRHACLNILRADPGLVERCVCRLFQDVPYATDYPTHTTALVKAIEDAGGRLKEERTDVTEVMPEKMHLLSVYASQWKTEVIQRRVQACSDALDAPPERYCELSYRVVAAPTHELDMLTTSAVKESVDRVAHDLAPWLRRNRSAPVIGLLLTVPVGRWSEDMRLLLDYFPSTRFEAHMQAKFAAEGEMFTSDRISIHVGGNRWRWVFGDALKTVMTRRIPLVIVSGRKVENKGRWLGRLGLFSDCLVAPMMSDFVVALQTVTREHNWSV